MPIEILAGWLLSEACKLFIVPIADGVRKKFVDEAAQRVAAPLITTVFGGRPEANSAQAVNGADSAVVSAQDAAQFVVEADDTALVDTIDNQSPAARTSLRKEMENILGVELGANDNVPRGTAQWYVSAYAAILWRIAMLASWEARPIAIQGALQGPDWVTVCVPKVRGKVIDPSEMWRASDDGPHLILRPLPDHSLADFFVRRIKDDGERGDVVGELNLKFERNPIAAFSPKASESVVDDWHRIDGFGSVWVVLQPDAALAQNFPTGLPSFLNPAAPRRLQNFDLHPLRYEQYPKDEWQPLLDISSKQGAIAALSKGADEFASRSEASAAALEAVLRAREI
jgi:hypothetical protein